MSEQTHYDTLRISRHAPASIVKAAYRTWMKEVHPDTGSQSDAGRAAAVNEAFRVLNNPVERARYDAQLDAASLASAGDGKDEEPDIEWGTEEEIDTSSSRRPTPV